MLSEQNQAITLPPPLPPHYYSYRSQSAHFLRLVDFWSRKTNTRFPRQAAKGEKPQAKMSVAPSPSFPSHSPLETQALPVTSYLLQKLQRVTNRPTLSVLVTHSWLDRSAELGHCSHQVHTTVQVWHGTISKRRNSLAQQATQTIICNHS